MRIAIQIQPRWAPFNRTQQQMLNGVEGESAEMQGLPRGMRDFYQRKCFEQPQHLHELSFATLRKTGFQQSAQLRELFRQLPGGAA